MTNNFKENILNYITNNIAPTSKDTTEIIEKIENKPRSDYKDYLPEHWNNLQIMGIIKSATNENYVLYGGYILQNGTAENDSKGIIIILNDKLEPIKTIFQFITGTDLRPIQKMIQIEDGTFVAIDSTIFANPEARGAIQSNTKRFIMLNNITVPDSNNNYKAILRTSYNLPYSNFFCMDIVKNPNSSHYAIAGATYLPYGNNYHRDGIRIIELKVNVGEANEWKETSTSANEYWIYGGFYASFSENDTLTWKVIMTRNENEISLYTWSGANRRIILEGTNTIKPYVDSLSMRNQVKFIDKNTVYFVVNNQRWGASVVSRYIALYKYDYITTSLKQIYYKNIGNFDFNESREGIFLNNLNGELYVNYCDNYSYENKTANYNYQRLENDVWSPILINENQKYRMEKFFNFTGNTYNLITNISIQDVMNTAYWYFTAIKEIFNRNNYNSTSYVDYDSAIPKYANIYDTNGIIFSRNLYNLTINGATTTGIVQIPNTLLNNITMSQEKLIGQTNQSLIDETETITKNIYETLYINFVNTLNVKDEDINKLYPESASYINNNINIGTEENCNNTFIGKIQINYSNSSITQNINWIWNTDHYEASFVIDATNEVPTIDFISNDETTVYITKELNVSVGNYYQVSQKLRIE